MKFITIKLFNGCKYNVFINENETVCSLKNKIETFLNIRKESQRLIFNGSPLTDENTLDNIPDKGVIHLVQQLTSIKE